MESHHDISFYWLGGGLHICLRQFCSECFLAANDRKPGCGCHNGGHIKRQCRVAQQTGDVRLGNVDQFNDLGRFLNGRDRVDPHHPMVGLRHLARLPRSPRRLRMAQTEIIKTSDPEGSPVRNLMRK